MSTIETSTTATNDNNTTDRAPEDAAELPPPSIEQDQDVAESTEQQRQQDEEEKHKEEILPPADAATTNQSIDDEGVTQHSFDDELVRPDAQDSNDDGEDGDDESENQDDCYSSNNNNNNINNGPAVTTNLLIAGDGINNTNSNNNINTVLHYFVKFTPPSVAPIIASLSPYLIALYNLLLEIIPVGGTDIEEIFSQLPRKGWRGSLIEEQCLAPLVSKSVLIKFTRDHRVAASSSSSRHHDRQQHQRGNNNRIVWYALVGDKSVPSIPVLKNQVPVSSHQPSVAQQQPQLQQQQQDSAPVGSSVASSSLLNLKSATKVYLENLKSLLPRDGLERSGIFAVMNHKHGWSDVKMQEEFLNELEAKGVISQHLPYPDIPSIVKVYLAAQQSTPSTMMTMSNNYHQSNSVTTTSEHNNYQNVNFSSSTGQVFLQQQQQQQQQHNNNNNNNNKNNNTNNNQGKIVTGLLSISQRLGKLLDSSPMVKNGPGGDLKQKERNVLYALLSKLFDHVGLERILDRGECIAKDKLLHDLATKGTKPMSDENELNNIYNWLIKHNFIKERFSNSRREHVIELHRHFRESMDSKWMINSNFKNEKEAGVRRSREGADVLGAVVPVEQQQQRQQQYLNLPSTTIPTSSRSADRVITEQDETRNNNNNSSRAPPPLLHHQQQHVQNSSPRNTATTTPPPHHHHHQIRTFSSRSNPISFPPPLVISNGRVFWRYSILPRLMMVPPPFIVVTPQSL